MCVKRRKSKEVLVPKREILDSHVQMVMSNWQEKVLESDHPTEFGKIPKKEKEKHSSDLQGETDEPYSAEPQQEQDDLEANHEFWSISGSLIYRHHVQERKF